MPEWFDEDEVSTLCDEIEQRMQKLVKKYGAREYGDEEDLASSFAARLEVAVENHELTYRPQNSFRLGAAYGEKVRLEPELYGLTGRLLTHRNQWSEEVKFGADILLIFESHLNGFPMKKGMLIQCKDNKHRRFVQTARPDLSLQCMKMHGVTDHSYVLLFTADGFRFAHNPYPIGPEGFKITAAQTLDLRSVFRDFFICTGGDPEIQTARVGDFERVANNLMAQRTLNIAAVPA